MYKIRLAVRGKKNARHYDIVAVDARRKRDSRLARKIGWYNPHAREIAKRYMLNVPMYEQLISCGAQPTTIATKIYKIYSLYLLNNTTIVQ
jgi:ribosomal protein S16